MQTARTWDIFCKVIDNFGDIGVCWRLACNLAARGQRVRLWVDDPSALAWIAPHDASGVRVRAWTPAVPQTGVDAPGDVVIEAFGCDVDAAWMASFKQTSRVWINLEYLSAETFAQRSHGLPSPVMSGPAAGMTKWFYYPGFTPNTGGLLREDDLVERQAQFKPQQWLKHIGVGDAKDSDNTYAADSVYGSDGSDGGDPNDRSDRNDRTGEQTISLFCYEPQALQPWLEQLARGPQRTHLLVTHGRAAAAVQTCLPALQQSGFENPIPPRPNKIGGVKLLLSEHLSIQYLPALTQRDYDHLLWSCHFNCVRGEDSLVRALWAGKPFVWHIYPQDDGAHAAKLDAFLDWLQAPADLRLFHHVWNGLSTQPLPALDLAAWGAVALAARERLWAQADAATQLMAFADAKFDQR